MPRADEGGAVVSSLVGVILKPLLQGEVVVSAVTKRLAGLDLNGKIAVIDHLDLDETAAESLIASGTAAVVNASQTMSGAYPSRGSLMLLSAQIPIYEISASDFAMFENGSLVEIYDNFIRVETFTVPCRKFDTRHWLQIYQSAQQNIDRLLERFIENTLQYADSEKKLILQKLALPSVACELAGRHALIVARGSGCRQDLAAISDYIRDRRPVAVAVDGGADLLLEQGVIPRFIIGDMDSVSTEALYCGAELIVHAYPDGVAPGMARLEQLGLAGQVHVIAAIGTSEDVAMRFADQAKADKIIAVGTRSNMIDFLEKGRKGMGSTLLTRLTLGEKLIDIKGIQTLLHAP
jgi:uncharacterized membrane-anchored protein